MCKQLGIPSPKKSLPVSHLNELASFCSKRSIPKPLFILTKEEGKGGSKFYEFLCKVGSVQVIGNGPSVKKARQSSAENMLTKLKSLGKDLIEEVHKKIDTYKSEFLDKYEFIMSLGSGGYGVVIEAENKITKRRVAIKRVNLTSDQETLREVQLLAKLDSNPNIVGLYHTWREVPPPGWQEQQDRTYGIQDNSITFSVNDDDTNDDFDTNVSLGVTSVYLYIEMELCQKKSLREWLDTNHGYNGRDPALLNIYFYQILSGVHYIHSKNVIHRDLKPSNIFFSLCGQNLKIGDFGLATVQKNRSLLLLDPERNESLKQSHTMNRGTSLYMSPEQEDSSKYDQKVDIWALGLILIELFLDLSDPNDRREALTEAKNRVIPNFQYKNLAKEMLDHNPRKRPEAKNILATYFKHNLQIKLPTPPIQAQERARSRHSSSTSIKQAQSF